MPKTYPPVGQCIYCGATRYSAEREKLGDEHIVPYCLNGDDVLPQASCKACEKKTGGLEHPDRDLVTEPYNIELFTKKVAHTEYVVVDLRLFGPIIFPKYTIVVGTIDR